jgi:hypothetical protein
MDGIYPRDVSRSYGTFVPVDPEILENHKMRIIRILRDSVIPLTTHEICFRLADEDPRIKVDTIYKDKTRKLILLEEGISIIRDRKRKEGNHMVNTWRHINGKDRVR